MNTIYRHGEQGWQLAPELEVITFSGGEPHVNVPAAAEIAGLDFIIDARVHSFTALGEVLVMNDALRRSRARQVNLFCPYLPGARQDRGAPLTARVYADIINAAHFDSVVGVDPHSPVMAALLDRFSAVESCDVLPLELINVPGATLICPDAGAAKRVEAVADRFGLSVLYARKHRDPATGQLSGFTCDPLPAGATGIVIDDICDGGGTFLGLADAIDAPRERLRLWTSHGIYSKGVAPLHARYSVLACTDSFPTPHLSEIEIVVDLNPTSYFPNEGIR